jgi:hypothetical protein
MMLVTAYEYGLLSPTNCFVYICMAHISVISDYSGSALVIKLFPLIYLVPRFVAGTARPRSISDPIDICMAQHCRGWLEHVLSIGQNSRHNYKTSLKNNEDESRCKRGGKSV